MGVDLRNHRLPRAIEIKVCPWVGVGRKGGASKQAWPRSCAILAKSVLRFQFCVVV